MPLHEATSKAEARAAVQAVFDRYKKLAEERGKTGLPQLYDYDCMTRAEIVDASPEGSVVFRFHITHEYANLNNVVHGGAYGVLFDMFTTTALTPLARPGYWEFMGGITRSLNITYLRGVPTDTTVLFRSHVVQHGKTVALVRGEMVSEDGKKVYAVADHHKVNVPMLPEHKAARVKWDDDMDKKARQPSAKGPKL